MARTAQLGVSLVEMAIVVAIGAVLVSVAAPHFGKSIERRAIEGAAAQLETDLQFARSLAVARNQSVRVRFEHDAAQSCYVIHTGAADGCHCDANGAAVCTAGATELRTVSFGPEHHLAVVSNVRSMLFDATKGTVSPAGTVAVSGASGTTLRQVVNIMGRVRSCTPGGADALPGYATC